jgi:hypothetical protein
MSEIRKGNPLLKKREGVSFFFFFKKKLRTACILFLSLLS